MRKPSGLTKNRKFKSDISSMVKDAIGASLEEHDVSGTEKPDVKDKDNNPYKIVDIITFCEHDYYLGLKLFPWQKIILKIFYMGQPGNTTLKLDNNDEPDCSNCVWENNTLQIESPCLSCERYCKSRRREFFQTAIDNQVLTTQEIEEWEGDHSELHDHFINEAQMIYRDLPDEFEEEVDAYGKPTGRKVKRKSITEDVREQLLSKMGKRFVELILVLGRRSGKALHVDTPIITTDGWKTMGEVQVGDRVFTPGGEPTKVIAATDIMYDRPCYEIEFSNGDKIIADEQHEWMVTPKSERKNSVRRKNFEIHNEKKTTGEIYQSYRIERNDGRTENNYSIDVTQPLEFEEKHLPIDPYVLGVWLGDGSKHNGNITTADPDMFNHFERCGFTVSKNHWNKYGYTIGKGEDTPALVTLLKNNNLHMNKHVPEDYLRSSIEQRVRLLQGLMDTDGYIAETNNKFGICEYCTVDQQLAESVFDLVIGLGIKATLKRGNATLDGRFISYKYRICFKCPSHINVFNIDRKKVVQENITQRKSDTGRIFITSVKKVASAPVKCIQVADPESMYLAGKTMIATHNSLLTSVIALYEAYQLIEMKNPHKVYNLLSGDPISILNVAVSENQAKEAIFEKIRAMVLSSPYYSDKVNKESIKTQSIRFYTEVDKQKNKTLAEQGIQEGYEGSIQILSGTSSASSQVGKTLACVIIDEMASMIQNEGSRMSDRELYEKLKPSIATFGAKGKIICLSNPLTQNGKFWDLYQQSFNDDSMLMFQLPTGHVNPSVPKKWLQAEKDKDPEAWAMQYGARFSGGAMEPLIPEQLVEKAFERGNILVHKSYGEPSQYYFAHADPAINSDNYAFVIAHAVPSLHMPGRKKVVIDHIKMWEPKPGMPVNFDEVDTYIDKIFRKFNIICLSFDQYNSIQSIQKLQRKGIPAKQTSFTRGYKEKIYTTLLDLFVNDLIDIPNSGDYSMEAKIQLKNLQRKFNMSSARIEAAKGFHDDIPDCIAGAAFMSLHHEGSIRLPDIRSSYLGIDPGERMASQRFHHRTGKESSYF